MLLAASLAFPACAAEAACAAETESEVSEENVSETAASESDVSGYAASEPGIEYDINPLYADEISEEDLICSEEEEEETLLNVTAFEESTESTYCTTIEEAAEIVRAEMKDRERNISVSYIGEDYSAYKTYYRAILYAAFEHTGEPDEGDYLYWAYRASTITTKRVEYTEDSYLFTFTYRLTYDTTADQEAEVEEKIDEILGEMDLDAMTDYEKASAVYAYVCDNVTYDYDNVNDSSYTLKYTAYAALINGTAICEGYACLLYRMLLTAGVDCRVIAGYDRAGDSPQEHSWNIAKICDTYYYLDSTWDAGDSEYSYFLKGTENFTSGGTLHLPWTSEDGSAFAYLITEDILNTYTISDEDCDLTAVHDYDFVTAEATCTEDAYTLYTCTVCGDSYIVTEEGSATGHSYTGVTTEATCTEDAYTLYTCLNCGDSYIVTEEGSATGHTYAAVVTEPTETEGGYTTYTCTVCGDSYFDDFTDALGSGDEENSEDGTGEAEAEDNADEEAAGDDTDEEAAGDDTAEEAAGDDTAEEAAGDDTAEEAAGDDTDEEAAGDGTGEEEAGNSTDEEDMESGANEQTVKTGTGGTVSKAKTAQSIKIKKKTAKKTFKYKRLKKKKKTFRIKASAKGRVTFQRIGKSKALRISKTGKVTVKKGTKKGIYKMKVRVKAAKTPKYKAASKKILVTVKVK